MHIAVASHQPLPAKGYGGPQRVILALVRGLAALGARVTLLAPAGTRVPEPPRGSARTRTSCRSANSRSLVASSLPASRRFANWNCIFVDSVQWFTGALKMP